MGTEQDRLVATLLEQYLQHLESGQGPDRAALLARHSDLAEQLAPALDSLDFVYGATRALQAGGDAGVDAGEQLGDYRLVREIGRGGMAVVYEAEQVSLGRRVALKVLPFASTLDQKQRQRFKNEVLAAAQLHHPHIVPIYTVGSERGVQYYAMQYVPGDSLAATIRRLQSGDGTGEAAGAGPRLPVPGAWSLSAPAFHVFAATLGKHAAEALDHAHQLGIVHRDVKPGNLLLDQDGTVFVADFGLARSMRDAGPTMSGEIVGTVRYMSPEQALGRRATVDHRTDVYSLGATLYELLTLRPAFPGNDARTLLDDLARREPVRPRRLNPALPIDLETVLLKAMAKEPAARYATAQEFAADLGSWLAKEPIQARRPSLRERGVRWARRHVAGLATTLSLLLVAALALAIGAKREEVNTRIALRKADAALHQANTNLDLAFAAVREFLTQVGTSRYEFAPHCTPQLERLFENALSFYDLYLTQRQHDVEGHTNKSFVLAALGRLPEAIDAADRAIDLAPRDELAWFARGSALYRMNRPDEAMVALTKALEIAPDAGRLHCQMGSTLMQQGRHEEALARFEHALRLDDTIAMAHSNRGACLQNLGRVAEALVACDRAVQLAPDFAPAHLNRSLALAMLGRLPEARLAAERAIAIDPAEPWVHLHLGAVLHGLGDREGAWTELDRALELDPKLGRGHYNKSVYLEERGHFDEAIAELELAIQYEPGYGPAYTNLALLLAARGEHQRALERAEQALAIDNRSTHGLCVRGQALGGLGRLPEALDSYRRAVAIDANCMIALANCAALLNRLQRYDEALHAADEALALDDRQPLTHLYKAIALFWLGRPGDSLVALDRANELDPNDAEVLRNRATCLEALGRAADAMRDYQHLVDLGHRTPFVLNQMAWLLATAADPASRDPKRAIELAHEAVDGDPGNASHWNTYGVALCRDGRWQDALQVFDTSLTLSDGGTTSDWYFLAIAHHHLGHVAEARTWYDKAVAATAATDPNLARFQAEAAALLEPVGGR